MVTGCGRWSTTANLPAQLLQRTLARRESIHAIASALAQGRPPSPSDVNDLTGGHGQCIGGAQLVLHNRSLSGPGIRKTRRSNPFWVRSAYRRWPSSLKPISLASNNVAVIIAAGCFSTRRRIKAADAAKWKSAGTAPNRSATRQNRKRRPRLERVPLSRYSQSPLPPSNAWHGWQRALPIGSIDRRSRAERDSAIDLAAVFFLQFAVVVQRIRPAPPPLKTICRRVTGPRGGRWRSLRAALMRSSHAARRLRPRPMKHLAHPARKRLVGFEKSTAHRAMNGL
jgi:hypothetical protein